MDEIRYIKTVYRKRGSGSGHMYSLMRFLDNTGNKYVWRVSRNDEVLMISERLGEDMHMTRQEYDMKRAVEASGLSEHFDALFSATATDPVSIPYVNPEVYGRMFAGSQGRRRLFPSNTNRSSHLPALFRFLEAGQGRLFISLFMDDHVLQVTVLGEYQGLSIMLQNLLDVMRPFGLFEHWSYTGDCVLEQLGSDRLFDTYFMREEEQSSAPETVSHQKHLEHKDYYQHTITNTNTSNFNAKEFRMANKEHIVVVMTRNSNASSSNDGEIKKLDEPYEKKGVVIEITDTELRLVFKNGPNKAVEAEAARNLYKRMHDKKLLGDWKFVR
ncbi:unnamed protein product [Fusarium graminearum]|uniref:Uncharacterized protein n=1 Tax=Gibberella zeae TaxID=5518 RepID=A0A9N8NH94_GIBZA|nr:unnamed protein product [Fusarium graminearum]